MPLYEFENPTTGQRLEMVLPVSQRDCGPVGYRRVMVPRRLGYLSGARNPTDVDVAAPRGFKQLEDTMPAREIERQTGFSVDHIKRVWGI